LRFQDRGSLDPTTNKGNSAELPLPSSSCRLSLHALLPITQPVAPQAFLEASLLLPRSVTADFNFPDWHYFGRGSGQYRAYHRYEFARNALAR